MRPRSGRYNSVAVSHQASLGRSAPDVRSESVGWGRVRAESRIGESEEAPRLDVFVSATRAVVAVVAWCEVPMDDGAQGRLVHERASFEAKKDHASRIVAEQLADAVSTHELYLRVSL